MSVDPSGVIVSNKWRLNRFVKMFCFCIVFGDQGRYEPRAVCVKELNGVVDTLDYDEGYFGVVFPLPFVAYITKIYQFSTFSSTAPFGRTIETVSLNRSFGRYF